MLAFVRHLSVINDLLTTSTKGIGATTNIAMLCVPELFESFSILLLVMADVPELHLVPNRCGIWSNLVDKKGCGGAIWTNLDVTSVSKQNDHIESCPVDEHLAYKMEKKALLKKRSAARKKRNPSRPFMMRKLPPRPPTHPHLAVFPFLNG
ncbi:hypothetical protein Tsp_00792 [Trichinella spiralis]|uniref:hypothetical protein n=1 Tax=Trichinella spiralis TaxID=6334 RepID=UPI0001EFCE4B|nr:hypothetical protein Tsp_00792 [Trichinella spiralis]